MQKASPIILSDDVHIALGKAAKSVVGSPENSVAIEHMLIAFLEAQPIVDLLRLCSPDADLEALHRELQTTVPLHLSGVPCPPKDHTIRARLRSFFSAPRAFSKEAESVLTNAIMRGHKSGQVNCRDVLLSFFDVETQSAADVMQRHGITRYDLVSFMAHGASRFSPGGSDDFGGTNASATLYLLNDDYTPMSFVVDILTSVLAYPSERAASTMLQIDSEGRAPCGTFPLWDALEKLNHIHQLAREQQHPLRVCLEAAP